jgi:pimeloyl-ACP methyl ester carboxylesterase
LDDPVMTSHARVTTGSREYSLEYVWISRERSVSPLLVFLHEGLGSVAMWSDFPRQLCAAGGFRGLVYSRPGYGRSTPRPPEEKWPVDFMHSQAREVLPAFLQAVGVDTPTDRPWLMGHSDGASIALLYAAAFPDRVAGVIALAPHVFVEDLSIESIARTRETYLATTDTQGPSLRVKLARYHNDPASAFWGWNDIWLDPAFRSWNIEPLLSEITRPVLVVQGEDDEYGTMAQVDSVGRHVPHARLLKLAQCGHSPQRDQPQQVIKVTVEFIATNT